MAGPAVEWRAIGRDPHRPEPASALQLASLGVDAAQRLAGAFSSIQSLGMGEPSARVSRGRLQSRALIMLERKLPNRSGA